MTSQHHRQRQHRDVRVQRRQKDARRADVAVEERYRRRRSPTGKMVEQARCSSYSAVREGCVGQTVTPSTTSVTVVQLQLRRQQTWVSLHRPNGWLERQHQSLVLCAFDLQCQLQQHVPRQWHPCRP